MKRRPGRSFSALMVAYLFFVLLISGALTGTSYLVLFFLGLVPGFLLTHIFSPFGIILVLIVYAMMISLGVGRSQLRPMNELTDAMYRVSQGDFSVRVDEDAPGDMGVLIRSFNDMASELGGIEMFRKDFINNFSHEFKTPIVSIRGFAKQLQRDDLSDEQRREYTAIIVSESERLANMASNILLLTKLENQQIVTDKEPYRLDEQLRGCILLLEKQWTAKDMELALELDEVTYVGNEEMMSHVWVNLLGNAVKFSPDGAELSVRCERRGGAAVTVIRDHGSGMDEATRKRIFEKFYQGDTAHATEGTGWGCRWSSASSTSAAARSTSKAAPARARRSPSRCPTRPPRAARKPLPGGAGTTARSAPAPEATARREGGEPGGRILKSVGARKRRPRFCLWDGRLCAGEGNPAAAFLESARARKTALLPLRRPALRKAQVRKAPRAFAFGTSASAGGGISASAARQRASGAQLSGGAGEGNLMAAFLESAGAENAASRFCLWDGRLAKGARVGCASRALRRISWTAGEERRPRFCLGDDRLCEG